MKNILLTLIAFILSNNSYSQKLLGQKRTVEITQKVYFDIYSGFKELVRKEIKVFDKKGRLIRNIEFGFHHNRNLNLIGDITSYKYEKNRLESEKHYSSENDFKNNHVLFYWNYVYKNSKKIKAISNHTSYQYNYDENNRLNEYIVTNWNSEKTRYSLKYDDQNKLIQKTQFYGNNIKNWTNTYTKKGDTLISKHYLFNHPKKNDTTKTVLKEVYKNDKIVYSHNVDYTDSKKKYIYSKNERLNLVFTKVIDESFEKELKTKLIYLKNGIIRQILKFELVKNKWTLKQRTDFELNGNSSILNKKEKNEVNEILINGN